MEEFSSNMTISVMMVYLVCHEILSMREKKTSYLDVSGLTTCLPASRQQAVPARAPFFDTSPWRENKNSGNSRVCGVEIFTISITIH